MTDLEAVVPPHEPAEDVLAVTGGIALDAIPIVGPMAERVLGDAIVTRERERRHEFDIAVVTAIQRVGEELTAAPSVAQVLKSDEFLAAYTRAARAAAETARESKRRRLATAVAQCGDWTTFSAAERVEFFRLVETLDDLHVWLLHFYDDPRAWLNAHDPERPPTIAAPQIARPLPQIVEDVRYFRGPVVQALRDLERHRLAFGPPKGSMAAGDMYRSRTTPKARRFLGFIREPNSVDAEPPSDQ